MLIDIKLKSYLFKHGFIDKDILALKKHGKDEYAIFVNEDKYDGELSPNGVFEYLKRKYFGLYQTDKGEIKVEPVLLQIGNKVLQNKLPIINGKYDLGNQCFIMVKNGFIVGFKP